jgi:hypothetical protein
MQLHSVVYRHDFCTLGALPTSAHAILYTLKPVTPDGVLSGLGYLKQIWPGKLIWASSHSGRQGGDQAAVVESLNKQMFGGTARGIRNLGKRSDSVTSPDPGVGTWNGNMAKAIYMWALGGNFICFTISSTIIAERGGNCRMQMGHTVLSDYMSGKIPFSRTNPGISGPPDVIMPS